MKFCQATTSNHSISITYSQCVEDINKIISREGYTGEKLFVHNEKVLNLDNVERRVAQQAGRLLKQSMDMAFGLTNIDGTIKQMLLVELKFNVENVSRLKEADLIGKVMGSTNVLGSEIKIKNEFYIILKKNKIKEAINRLYRILQRTDYKFIPKDIESLKVDYFGSITDSVGN